MSSLPAEVQASYVVIIDSILAASDLNTITSKRIREGLQAAVDYDITPHKDAIKTLIMSRFDKFVVDDNTQPHTNGHSTSTKAESLVGKHKSSLPVVNGHSATVKAEVSPVKHKANPSVAKTSSPEKTAHKKKSASEDDESEHKKSSSDAKSAQKRKSASEDEESELSNAPTTPSPKKKRKAEPATDDDAAFAAKLQAEENSRARPTRNGVNKKKVVVKKKKSSKKKASEKVKAEDDSDLDGSETGDDKKVNRSGGFHKPLLLSPPLSALLDGEIQLSRPQTVKRIWDYVKEHDLQDPTDKRLIRCDDAMRAVFKQDKVHMFKMNKILGDNLFNPDE